jgi:hypothetical protein
MHTSLPAAALLAMLVEVEAATALVSFGTLVALCLVCNCQLYRRYFPGVQLRFTRCVWTATRGHADWNASGHVGSLPGSRHLLSCTCMHAG